MKYAFFLIKLTCLCTILFCALAVKPQTNNVNIYVVRDTIALWDKRYKSEIKWGFSNVDMNEKTIQTAIFAFKAGDIAPDLSNMSNIFKDVPTKHFVVLSSNKLKIKKIRGTKRNRAWNDFATPRHSGSIPSQVIIINGNMLFYKDGELKYFFDKHLTEKYLKEQSD